jgi:tetratricopeptide (TPR) repeat protein
VQLEQSPFLSLISEQRIRRMLRLMGRPVDVELTPEVAREVCERTGSTAVLEGSIANLGTRYVVGLRATNCRTGDLLDNEQVQVTRKEEVLNALNQIAGKFRTLAGESLATRTRHDTPLAEATTASLEALRAYSAGWKVNLSNGAAAALPFFRRATEIDPEFAMAYASLGRMYADIDESDLSAENVRRAWELRNRTSDPEKFYIGAVYDTLVTGNLERAHETCEAWARSYQRDPRPYMTQLNKTKGQYENAAADARKAIEIDPDFAMGYYSLAVNNIYLDYRAEAEDVLRRAADRGLEIDELIMLRYDIAFLRNDVEGMKREAARARTRPGAESWIASREAMAEAYFGRLEQARSMSQRAVEQAEQAVQGERAFGKPALPYGRLSSGMLLRLAKE